MFSVFLLLYCGLHHMGSKIELFFDHTQRNESVQEQLNLPSTSSSSQMCLSKDAPRSSTASSSIL